MSVQQSQPHVTRSVLRPPPLLGRPQPPGGSQVLHHALQAGPGLVTVIMRSLFALATLSPK